ncbi:hypothetical protein Anas_02787 [Armadillidium nasatum]|uniref:Uncharacterized protein n=1 Tax=Armadillidium nasatum TaxID=96803 RepID=A0A5N5SRC9_9CRUS|nr:hypothetical protein Anas_02787 [Armadillidium nasatum]
MLKWATSYHVYGTLQKDSNLWSYSKAAPLRVYDSDFLTFLKWRYTKSFLLYYDTHSHFCLELDKISSYVNNKWAINIIITQDLYPGINYKPNIGHYFIYLLHLKNKLQKLYTQNIDGLEKR